MSNTKLFIDVHAIQTLPPSNMNRDDSGSPKTAQYGGVKRARVSSQAWKRAMRKYFADNGDGNVGVRTKYIVSYLAELIKSEDGSISDEDSDKLAQDAFSAAGVGTKTEKNGDITAKALFFLGKKQALALAKAAVKYKSGIDAKNKDIKKEFQSLLKDNPEVDIALFGRMLADDPSLNEDASAQVAHAISTHAVQTEYDYFTAIDDRKPDDQAGAAMIETVEYNSSTLYRYANISAHELLNQLGDKDSTINAIKLFIEAFSNSLPTGKINTFANDTLPQAIMVNIRDDRPVNLVSAFENPVRSKDGYVEESVKRLFEELPKSEKFVHKPVLTLYLTQTGMTANEGKEEGSLANLVDELGEKLSNIL